MTTKARALANLLSQGNIFADSQVAASEITGLHTVATTGSYADLVNKPTVVSHFTNDANYASTTYVNTQVSNLVASAPAALDTLNELASALGNDASFSATTATALGNRLRVDTAAQSLSSTQKTNAKTNLDLQNVENKSSATIRGELTSSNVTTALGFTPYNATNPNAYISGNQTITFSGDATGSGAVTVALTLANSGVTAGTYGSSTNIPQLVVDAKGRVTSVSNVAVSIPSGALTFTGDVTGSGSTGSSTALTLANSGVTAGTYTKVTVDAKGRVTTGATLASADLPTYTGSLTSAQVTGALGFIPGTGVSLTITDDSANEEVDVTVTNTGVTSVSGTGTVSGLTLSGTVTTTGSLTLGGSLTLSSGQITTGLGFTPSNATQLTAAVTQSNFDTIKLPGLYQYDGTMTSTPNGRANYRSIEIGSNGRYSQVALPWDQDGMWFRRQQDSTWGTWREVLHSGNVSSYALPIGGGTVSGVVRINNQLQVGQNTNGTATIDAYGGHAWFGRDSNTTGIRIDSSGNVHTTAALNSVGALTQNGNQVLHAGNYTTYAEPRVYRGISNGNWQTFTDNSGEFRVDEVHDINNGSHSNQPPGVYTYGGVLSWRGNNHSFQLYASHTGDLTFKTQWGNDNYSGWRNILHAANYTSYSPSLTGSGASGTWGINITGNAATATSADQIDGWGFRNTGSNSGVNADTIESNGITYYTAGVTNFSGNSTDGALYSQAYSSSWQHQIAADYRSGQIALRGKNNGTWQSWRTVLDSSNYTNYTGGLSTTNNWTGVNYFRSNQNTTGSSPPLQAYSSDSGGAIMSFHRGGYYAVNMGLDSDNVFRIGGWSASANRLQMDMSGNLTMAGNVTAYSDERLKKDWASLPENFVERLAKVKNGTYTRTDEDMRQVGVSAQSLQPLLPEAVLEGEHLSVAYGNAALAACVELAKELVKLKQEILELKAQKNV